MNTVRYTAIRALIDFETARAEMPLQPLGYSGHSKRFERFRARAYRLLVGVALVVGAAVLAMEWL